MRTAGRPVIALLTLAAALALIGCTPAAGPLGTPSSPAPTGDASVAPPSGDATPGPTATAGATTSPPGNPSTTPAGDATPAATPPRSTATPVPTATPTPAGTTLVRAYYFLGTNTNSDGISVGLTPVLRAVPKTQGIAAAALRALFAGPTEAERQATPTLRTEIPDGSRVLSIAIRNGTATIQMSREFGSGTINSTWGALAQVVYTATQFPSVTSVDFQFEGGTFPVALASPPDRTTFEWALPGIFVDHPAWGAGAGNPVVVSGLANVFEAAFRVQVKDAKGKVIADQQVMASCGTGCWGTFSTSVGYTVAKAQWGTLRVFDLSAKDGSAIDVTEYPVWLTPAS